jgi:flagellar basal-body rod protein FlgF
MDPLLISAASGMKARMESLDMLANNMANQSTSGFKADREFYTTFADQLADDLPLVERRWTDFSQGTIEPTGNPLDLALDGTGFFALNTPTGTVYTRGGKFQISGARELTSAEGYTLRNVRNQGKPIVVDPLQPVGIDAGGVVRQNGQELGQIEIAGFANATDALKKLGTSYFAQSPGSTSAPGQAPSQAKLQQGALEQSNVPPTDAAVRLVSVMRQFEMLQRAMSVGAEMNKRAVDEVARAS